MKKISGIIYLLSTILIGLRINGKIELNKHGLF